MGMSEKEEQLERIKYMETVFDRCQEKFQALEKAMDEYKAVQADVMQLIHYYDSGVWREDYMADQNGEFPAELKRGVLSEDGIYNLMTDMVWLKREMTDLGEK